MYSPVVKIEGIHKKMLCYYLEKGVADYKQRPSLFIQNKTINTQANKIGFMIYENFYQRAWK